MKLKLILVGKTVGAPLKEGIADYVGRLKHYAAFSVEEIPELKQVSALSRDQIKEREGALIAARLKDSDYVILLDEHGRRFTSVSWARDLEQKLLHGSRDLVFVVGGAYGFSKQVTDRADELLSLSEMTFSHQLVRLVFVEQLYRAFTIIRGEPYHHE
jgi:Uncharacterized conserved protein